MSQRRICVITGSRAEYGILRGLMTAIERSDSLQLQVIATAMHLAPDFGLTYRQIEEDGFRIDAKVEMLLAGDSGASITKSMGIGLIGLADALENLKPDLVVLLGDRFETLVAAQAAMMASVPVAHLHGGEITEGAVDDSIRHAITKMAQLHFVATESYRQRVIQLGESPDRVFLSGAPAIDAIKQLPLLARDELQQQLGFQFGELNFLLTYHPLTLAAEGYSSDLSFLFEALDHYSTARIIITLPNADAGNRVLIEQFKQYAGIQADRVFLTESLGQLRYFSVLQYVDAVIGNSSSGLLEVPSFGKPTVNIGDRQKGRIRPASVIDCQENYPSLVNAIDQALSAPFKSLSAEVDNPYGNGEAVPKIIEIIEHTDLSVLNRKVFYDIDFKT